MMNTFLLFIIINAQVNIGKGSLFDGYEELNLTCNIHNLPCLDQQEWWGPEEMNGYEDTSVRPFRIEFHEEMIQDLRYRLKNHRKLIPPLKGTKFEYGFNTRVLEDWIQYWADGYPFEERERFLNKYPLFKTNVQGLDIFFVWVKPRNVPRNKEIVPLLLLHGWPGSVREFYEAIPLLTKVEKGCDFVLELVIPGLPGFGYTDSAVRPGLGAAQAAVIFKNLMGRLGFRQFYVQGGDFGSIVANYMSTLYPKVILGFHSNWPFILHPTARLMHIFGAIYPPVVVDPSLAYRMYPLWDFFTWLNRETGYLHEQATKPDSLGVGITDSPSGLLAYNLEKFYLALTVGVPRDHILDNIMMYWAPNAITTAFRFYAETFNKRQFGLGLELIPAQVPMWAIQAEKEIAYSSPPLIRVKFPLLVNATAIREGGHFLAFETPEIFSNDVITAIGAFRSLQLKRGELQPISTQPDYSWSISLMDLWTAIAHVCYNPDAWLVRAFLAFAWDALVKILQRLFNYKVMGLLASKIRFY